MLDKFAAQLYRAGLEKKDPLVAAFTSLPLDSLQKVASGEWGCGGNQDWLERFKGTPLYDQALEILGEELHQEAQEMQSRQQQQQFYSAGDQLRLRKKLLELELARSEMASHEPPMPGPTPDVPTAASPGPQGAATQSSVQPPEGAPPKTAASKVKETVQALTDFAGGVGLGTSTPVWSPLVTAGKAARGGSVDAFEAGMGAGAPLGAYGVYRLGKHVGKKQEAKKHEKKEEGETHKKSSVDISMLAAAMREDLQKQAAMNVPSKETLHALWDLIRRNPGVAAGAGLGVAEGVYSGLRGDSEGHGGGILSAAGKGLTHGLLGAGLGYGAQGLVRSGIGAKRVADRLARENAARALEGGAARELEGGLLGEFGRQVKARGIRAIRGQNRNEIGGAQGLLKKLHASLLPDTPSPWMTAAQNQEANRYADYVNRPTPRPFGPGSGPSALDLRRAAATSAAPPASAAAPVSVPAPPSGPMSSPS